MSIFRRPCPNVRTPQIGHRDHIRSSSSTLSWIFIPVWSHQHFPRRRNNTIPLFLGIWLDGRCTMASDRAHQARPRNRSIQLGQAAMPSAATAPEPAPPRREPIKRTSSLPVSQESPRLQGSAASRGPGSVQPQCNLLDIEETPTMLLPNQRPCRLTCGMSQNAPQLDSGTSKELSHSPPADSTRVPAKDSACQHVLTASILCPISSALTQDCLV